MPLAAKCPWFRDGACTSPALGGGPDNSVINVSVCLGGPEQYTRCKFYVAPPKDSSASLKRYGKPLMLINSLPKEPRSGCEFFRVIRHDSGVFLASCEVLGRYLTRYEVSLCEKYWRDCPFRRQKLRITR